MSFGQKPTNILVADPDEQFISMKYSENSKKTFITTTKGRMIILNENDEIISTMTFPALGNVDLDHKGYFGVFSDENYNVHLFTQWNLKLINTYKITDEAGQGALRVVFTPHGLVCSTFKNVYRIDTSKTVLNIAPSFTVLDYNAKNDVLLLGKWDNTIPLDRKVQELFISTGKDLTEKQHVLSIPNTFELYSYLLDNGRQVMSYDGRGNYHIVMIGTHQKAVLQQEGLPENKRQYHLAKINDSTIMLVQRNPHTLRFRTIYSQEIDRQVNINQSVMNNQVFTKNGMIYYITAEGNGNKVVAIK